MEYALWTLVGAVILIIAKNMIRKLTSDQHFQLSLNDLVVDVTINKGSGKLDISVDDQVIPTGASPFGRLKRSHEINLVSRNNKRVKLVIERPRVFDAWRPWTVQLLHGDDVVDAEEI